MGKAKKMFGIEQDKFRMKKLRAWFSNNSLCENLFLGLIDSIDFWMIKKVAIFFTSWNLVGTERVFVYVCHEQHSMEMNFGTI